MKKLKFLLGAGSVLAAVFALTLLGCPKEAEESQIDSRLIGSWSNGLPGGLYKEFEIGSDSKFTASINPAYLARYNGALSQGASADQADQVALGQLAELGSSEEDARWTVTGKLVKEDGDVYFLNDLDETTGKPADPSQPDGGTADTMVGTYHGQRVQITFDDSLSTFTFASAQDDDQVTAFFGGEYTKK
jgi:hypothetical protein